MISDAIRDLKQKVNWIQLLSATIPHTFHNIIDSNNTLVFDLYDPTGVSLLSSHTFSIATGHYDGNTLIAAVLAGLNSTGNTYTIVMDSIKDIMTITNTNGNQIHLKFNDSTMMRVLGYLDDAKGVSIVADRQPDLRGVVDVLIQSNITQNKPVRYSGDDGSTNTFLGIMPVDVPYGQTIFYKNDNINDRIATNHLPESVEIQLRNRKNLPLEINNFDWKVVILINYSE